MDVQVARPDSFVVAFKGDKVSTPYLVTVDGAKTGVAGKIDDTSGTYSSNANLSCVAYCDNTGATIVSCATTLADASTLTEAMAIAGATIVEQGATLTLEGDTYFKAYHPNLTASTQIMFDKA